MITLMAAACTKQEFEDAYPDPSRISTSSVEKQFAGILYTNREYVVPSYWNYFVVLRTTVNRYTQAVGWVNADGQYVPGGGLVTDRWNNYYATIAQYRELENIYNKLTADDQALKRIFMIAGTIYVYDQTQKNVDLHGDIPFTQAGMLSRNGGDYQASLPAYDNAEELYTKMLDDLKAFADELNTIDILPAVQTGFATQDIVNNGDIDLWRIYCNSLRLRMLMRVSGAASFASRADTEIASILNNPSDYPVVTNNDENIQIEIHDLNTPINSTGFRTGLEDWQGNLAGKAMIDHMVTANDPRLRVMFEPGANAGGDYAGIDPLAAPADQQTLADGGTISIYNRSTLSRNQYFPGVLINAAEIDFLKAEYYLKNGDDASAKDAYNDGIANSIDEYYDFRAVSNDNVAGPVTPADDAEIAAYQGEASVSWDAAADDAAKLNLIATQKWIHFSVVQPIEGWAEQRRLNLPDLDFKVDNTNAQPLPPQRWLYANSELVYNTEHYMEVQSEDLLTVKLFWDAN
jgi:hypothetical protein